MSEYITQEILDIFGIIIFSLCLLGVSKVWIDGIRGLKAKSEEIKRKERRTSLKDKTE